jgi:hypothetical protein
MSGFPPTNGGFVVDSEGEAQDYAEWRESQEAEDYDASCDTEFGPQVNGQAWSAGAQPPEPTSYQERHAWATVLRTAGIGISLAVALAGLLLALVGPSHSAPDDHNSWPTGYTNPPLPSMPPTKEALPAPEPVWPPPSVGDAQEITHDGAFLQTFHQAGFTITDPATVVTNAHIVCQNLAVASRSTVVLFMYRSDPVYAGWTIPQVATLVDLAAQFYCPGLE